jgi:hypothetical protein
MMEKTSGLRGVGVALAALVALTSAGCECSTSPPASRRDAGSDAGDLFDGGPLTPPPDGGGPRDAYTPPNPDAYFFDDPPPATCYPDGGMGPWPDPPGGTPDCPDDRNREGCRCDGVGTTAPCWPGPRANRMRGLCRDGVTTCEPFDEFGGRWGACVGAVLPQPGVTLGPGACECFSAGRWQIDNLSPCFVDYGGAGVYAVSTYIGADGNARCPTLAAGSPPPPAPQAGTTWSTSRLTVDCAGRFRLCYRLRAGNASAPSPSDCVLSESCVETWYPEANVTQELPELPAWTSSNSACATAFRDTGGYGEMAVVGTSIECDDIDDGSGGEYVFNRVNYCPLICNEMPTLPECVGCMMGGSGAF